MHSKMHWVVSWEIWKLVIEGKSSNMLLERIVYSILCLVLLVYMVSKYFKEHNNIYLAMVGLQIIGATVQLLSLFINMYMDVFIQVYILFFGIIAPSVIFITEYAGMDLTETLDIKFGDYYAKKAEYGKAVERYKKAIARNGKNPLTFSKLGKVYNALGDRRTAFDKFAKAVELNRKDYESYYEIGIIFNELGKKADAKIMLDNALRIKPDYTPASELLAVVLCAQNKYDEAISVYKDAIRYEPDNYQLYYSMGIVRTELRDFNEAKDCYEKAIELNPDLYEAYFSLGQIYLLKGELIDAETMFKRALYNKDLAAKSYYQLAKVYILNGEDIKAVTYLEYAIEIDASYRYKADSEPLFEKIKDYLTGLHMVSQVQMKLEKEIDKKVSENYKADDYQQIDDEEAQFNYMDRFSDKS